MWLETTKIIKSKSSDIISHSTLILGFWWALWIISNYIGNYVLKSAFKAETIENFLNSTIADMVMSMIGIPLAILTVMIIKSYSMKEELLAGLEK
jgi:spore maturation protein SpmB